MEHNDKEHLFNSSEEYLFEVKTTNFKIFLNKLVETLENLDVDDENYENDMYNTIIIGEELIKQFELIQNRILDNNDKKSPTNLRKMEKKIEKLIKENEVDKIALETLNNSCIKEKEICDNLNKENENNKIALETLNNLYIKEKEICDNLNKENEDNKVKVEESNKIINNLEMLLSNQGYELMKLHNDTKDINVLDEIIFEDDIPKQSPEYLSKLNEGNVKIIKQKNEKIKTLELEISDMSTKINNLTETNNTLLNKTHKLEENNIELNNLLSITIVTKNKLEESFIKYNEDVNMLNNKLRSLADENYNLKLHKDINNDDIKIPLLERQKTLKFFEATEEKQTCNFCDIL